MAHIERYIVSEILKPLVAVGGILIGCLAVLCGAGDLAGA